MPELLMFAGCEKLLVDEMGNPSLISLLQTITVDIPANIAVPPNILSPNQWDVVTLWRALTDDEVGAEYTQIVEVVMPEGGAMPLRSQVTFALPPRNAVHRNKVHVIGIPVSVAGEVRVTLRIHRPGEPVPEQPYAVWPLFIVHNRVEAVGQ